MFEHTYINIISYVTHKVEISKMTKELVIYISLDKYKIKGGVVL